jgi:uncharacterized membrane protein SpoIIM required for sporulation
MVLESLISLKKAEHSPWDMFFIGLLFASVAIFLSLWIFKDHASLVMVFLTVMACIPIIHNALSQEETSDARIKKERTILKHHTKALLFFIALFLGITTAFSIWYVFLPGNLAEVSYATQIATIKSINSRVLGQSLYSSSISPSNVYMQIVSNNLKVLLFCVFFSFFYGAGAIFILAWNASVIGAAIGTFIRSNMASYASSIGLVRTAGYFHIFSLGILRYMIHGLPEIASYFVGALAGGIISFAVIRHDFKSKTFKRIMFDSLDLMFISIALIFIAAFVEVYITPIFF